MTTTSVSSSAGGAVGPGGRRPGDAGVRGDAPVAEQAHDAPQVVAGGAQHVDPAVGVVDPVDRHLVDAVAVPLGQHEEFGVEEPVVVGDERHQAAGHLGPGRLEPALGVGERVVQAGLEQQVVRARDDLALGAPHHVGAAGEPGPDRHVAVPGEQGRHERQQRLERGRQVGVHVGDHSGRAGRPHRPQCPAAALLADVQRTDRVELGGQPVGQRAGVVGAPVVDDRDLGGERELAIQEGAERPHAGADPAGLVVDRYHDLDQGRCVEGAGAAGAIGRCHRPMVGSRPGVGLSLACEPPKNHGRWHRRARVRRRRPADRVHRVLPARAQRAVHACAKEW